MRLMGAGQVIEHCSRLGTAHRARAELQGHGSVTGYRGNKGFTWLRLWGSSSGSRVSGCWFWSRVRGSGYGARAIGYSQDSGYRTTYRFRV